MIGAGPKAVALATKRHVLARNRLPVPTLAVFDENHLAAHWSGECGYTNGDLPLGTPPEKDVGFPYLSQATSSATTNKRINAEMLDYSWAAFNISHDARNFAEWIDRGRPNPPHRIWAAYLDWVAERIGLLIEKQKLIGIGLEEGRWLLSFAGREPILTDGLVITGPGPPKRTVPITGSSAGVYNGKTFWTQSCAAKVRDCIKSEGQVAVIGSGETAAAIVAHLAEQSPRFQIDIISREGIVYTRGESFEENRLYSDPGSWPEFPREVRQRFVSRTDRGVFSVANKSILNRREHVATQAGEVVRIEAGGAQGISLELKHEKRLGPYELVVDATGFARDWFREIMTPEALTTLSDALPPLSHRSPCARAKEALSPTGAKPTDEQLAGSIGRDLAVAGLRPLLHLPTFAGISQGPGFASLGCLGTLSDRILRPHWHRQGAPS